VTLAHHSSIAEHCWIAAGTVISGQASVLRNSFIGVNATVVNEVTVGEYNIVGAGALITKDTKPHTVHLARSAEPFRYSSDDYVKYFGI
jgi:carbonic anhydrase/acetyltransferase-like protein (isoleucine patch superfamily)